MDKVLDISDLSQEQLTENYLWRSTTTYFEEDQFILKVKTLFQGIILIYRSVTKQIIWLRRKQIKDMKDQKSKPSQFHLL